MLNSIIFTTKESALAQINSFLSNSEDEDYQVNEYDLNGKSYIDLVIDGQVWLRFCVS